MWGLRLFCVIIVGEVLLLLVFLGLALREKITEKLLTNNVKCSIIIKQKRRSNPLLTLSYRKRLINIVILVFIYKIYIRTLFRRWVGL